jgi:hypothetical protein
VPATHTCTTTHWWRTACPSRHPPPQLEDLRQQAEALEASQAAAAAEYERLAERNTAELAALKAARGAELAAAVVRAARASHLFLIVWGRGGRRRRRLGYGCSGIRVSVLQEVDAATAASL